MLKFSVWIRPLFCMTLFWIFEIGSLCPPQGPPKEFGPLKVKLFIYCAILIQFIVRFWFKPHYPGGNKAPIHKFLSQLLLVSIWKCCVSNFKMSFRGPNSFGGPWWGQRDPISKNRKSLIQNGGLNPHRKFQHSSSIRKCLKIGRTEIRRKRRKSSWIQFWPF